MKKLKVPMILKTVREYGVNGQVRLEKHKGRLVLQSGDPFGNPHAYVQIDLLDLLKAIMPLVYMLLTACNMDDPGPCTGEGVK